MLYSTRAGQREENPCSWRFFHETDRSYRGLSGVRAARCRLWRRAARRASRATTVAVVGDGHITQAEWNALIDQTKNNFTATHRKFPAAGSVDLANLKTNATQFLIQSSEYQQEATKLGVTVSDKDVEARLEQIKKQYYGNPAGPDAGDAGADGQALPAGAEAAGLHRRAGPLRDQAAADPREGLQTTSPRTSRSRTATSQTYYDKNKAQYETPAQPASRDVRHILVKTKAQADRLYAQLQKNPGKFAALAKKYSTDTSSRAERRAAAPADAVKGRMVKPFEDVAFSIKTNVDLEAGALAVRLAHHRGARRRSSPARPRSRRRSRR